eukprot:14541856-Ditylum_brightwellii.AAC.1
MTSTALEENRISKISVAIHMAIAMLCLLVTGCRSNVMRAVTTTMTIKIYERSASLQRRELRDWAGWVLCGCSMIL